MKKITYKELSKKTGLSIGTISRYFNDGYISEKNRKVIDEIVTELNYVPNQVAANIRRESNEIFILRQRSNSSSISNAILKIVELHGDDSIVKYFDDTEQSFEKALLWALGHKNKGIIVFPPYEKKEFATKLLERYSTTNNIVVYDIESENLKTINYDIDEQIKKISEHETKVNFIYSDNTDTTFTKIQKSLTNHFKQVNIWHIDQLDSVNKEELILFEYNGLISNLEHRILGYNFKKLLLISSNNEWYYNAKYWIQLDFSKIGEDLYATVKKDQQIDNNYTELHILEPLNKM